jgi:RND family efflux transporter MFP subunit
MTANSEKVRLLRQLSGQASAGAQPIQESQANPQGRTFGWTALAAVGLLGTGIGAAIFLFAADTGSVAPQKGQAAAAQQARPAPAGAPAGSLTASGYVVARRIATVSSQITGRLTDVLVEEGAVVHKGQLLARLDSSIARVDVAGARASHAAAAAEIESIRARLREAEIRRGRGEALRGRGFISKADLDRTTAEVGALRASLDQARARTDVARYNIDRESTDLSWHEIRAPFSGVIVDKAAQPGEIVSPLSSGGFTRTGIYTIVDMDSLEVEVDVNEANIQRITPGQAANVQIEAYPDLPIKGTVAAIVPTANRDRATIRVRVRIESRDSRILPEMAARVTFAPVGNTGSR